MGIEPKIRIKVKNLHDQGLKHDILLAIAGKDIRQKMAIESLVSRTRLLLETVSKLPNPLLKSRKPPLRKSDAFCELLPRVLM